MILNKKTKIIAILIVAFCIIFVLVVYNFTVHNFIIAGTDNKIYSSDITELDFRKNRLTENDYDKLRYFTCLKTLNLRLNEISSVEFVKSMPELEHLEFMSSKFSYGILTSEDLSEKKMPHNPDKSVIDYTPLKTLKKLKVLCISGNTNKDISFLKELNMLEELEISGSSFKLGEEQTKYISALVNLEKLNLSRSVISSTEFLGNLKNLRFLDLSECELEQANISDIMSLTELEKISLPNSRIDDIFRLSELKNLKTVITGNCEYDEVELKPLYDKGIEILEFMPLL
jgi:Leucine-rich repeat (LRR) protein